MMLGILTLISALSISAVAIYYSVAGLMTIFAAAALPIMIMGGVLEIGKLVTAVWLHRYWSKATWWLKTYLTTAVVVLMFITSMGIFGFLSKAHIEQTASANEGIAQIEKIEKEIARNEEIIARAESKIKELETSGTGATTQLQSQIDKEQERIDSAYSRIQPAIDEQNKIIADVTALYQQELDNIDADLDKLQGYIDAGEIAKAQGMIGAKADGAYGPKTAAAFTAYQERKKAERNEWLTKIQDAANSPTVKAAREEITRLRSNAEQQIAESNALINNLREQLKSNSGNDLQTILNEQSERVRSASSEIDTLLDSKFSLESEYRKLEAEVGPVKYIAEFIYGERADTNLLEEAVRWVIIVIIFVFDPLAVLLLIAAQYTFEFNRKPKDDNGGWLRQYEQARAQRIIDNPGYTVDVPEEKENENDRREDTEKTEQTDQGVPETRQEETVEAQTEDDSVVAASKERLEDVAKSYITTNDADGELVPEADPTVADATTNSVESTEVQVDDSEVIEKKDTSSVTEELSEELKAARTKELEDQEDDHTWTDAKRAWKDAHPFETIKEHKEKYINGEVDRLPWEDYLESKKKTYIMKQGNEQVRKTTE